MLAARRTDRVKGRMKLLISSIITMKGIKAPGVPNGTRWASILLGDDTQAHVMWPTQIGRAKENAAVRWAVEVNTYGASPKTLFNKIKRNRVNGIALDPRALKLPNTAFISPSTAFIRLRVNV